MCGPGWDSDMIFGPVRHLGWTWPVYPLRAKQCVERKVSLNVTPATLHCRYFFPLLYSATTSSRYFTLVQPPPWVFLHTQNVQCCTEVVVKRSEERSRSPFCRWSLVRRRRASAAWDGGPRRHTSLRDRSPTRNTFPLRTQAPSALAGLKTRAAWEVLKGQTIQLATLRGDVLYLWSVS